MKNFKVGVSICLLLLNISTFAYLNHIDKEKTKKHETYEPKVSIEEKIEYDIDFSNEEPENTPASTDTNHFARYIIKSDENNLILVTVLENGKETISPMPDIDVDYLTEIDRQHLKQGIELNTKEELFKLIEDYSS